MEEVKVKKPRKKKSSGVNEASEVIEQAAAEAKEEQPLSPQEQAEMLRNYVASMEKTQGHSDENVRDIIDAVYRRFLLILNYSTLSKDPSFREVKSELKKVYDDEIERYSGESK